MNQRTAEQNRIAGALAHQHGIDIDRVFFPDPKNPVKPWLGADELILIARQSARLQAIEEKFDSFIHPLNQVVHTAKVADSDGRVYERCGVATLGEKSPAGDGFDEHALAATRALTATLTAAGFNPLRSSSTVKSDQKQSSITLDAEEDQRRPQLRHIHALAQDQGLITYGDSGRDDSGYRRFLRDNFGVDSVKGMNATERASVINKLQTQQAEIENL